MEGPAVLVFEDLHWADPALLAFLEHLADWSQGVPLVLVCTARPELQEQHPTWAAGLRNANTINLAPLTDEETARLIGSLMHRAVLPAETQRALLERAGGNPLYAEEFVRLLSDRGELEGELPDSVQALIAARLDTLTPKRKGLLQDASVVGKLFWAGALVEMGDRDPGEVEVALHELARKELVRPARASSMAGEAEYGFWHALVRDVCYGQIPRAARAGRHRGAAAWIEGKAGERVEDLADVLAYHFLTALELTRAAGLDESRELQEQAARYLGLAGQRALGLDVDRAEQHLARALELTPEGDTERPLLLERWAQAAQQQNRLREARDALEQALAHHRDQGNDLASGRTLTQLSLVLGRLGDPRREETLIEALHLLEAQPPGPELVAAYARLATLRSLAAANVDAITAADQALVLAAQLGLPEPADALGLRGAARAYLGEREGVEETRRALTLALEQGEAESRRRPVQQPRVPRLAVRGAGSLPRRLWRGDRVLPPARHHRVRGAHGRRGSSAAGGGRPGRAGTHRGSPGRRPARARRGPRLRRPAVHAAAAARRTRRPPADARPGANADRRPRQRRTTTDRTGGRRRRPAPPRPGEARAGTRAARRARRARRHPRRARLRHRPARPRPHRARARRHALATSLAAGVQPVTPYHQHALAASRAQLAETTGDHAEATGLYADAAERWQQFGNLPEQAYALLGHGRCLTALGQPAEDRSRKRATCSPPWATSPRSPKPGRCSPKTRPQPCRDWGFGPPRFGLGNVRRSGASPRVGTTREARLLEEGAPPGGNPVSPHGVGRAGLEPATLGSKSLPAVSGGLTPSPIRGSRSGVPGLGPLAGLTSSQGVAWPHGGPTSRRWRPLRGGSR